MRALLFCLLLAGCAGKLKPDSVPGAMASHYPTAEFTACGTRFVGLGICPAYQGGVLEVQGYYKGTIQIDSERCNIHIKTRYENSQSVKVALANTSCVVDFVVSPEYPNDAKSGIVIESLKGRLYWKSLPQGAAYFSQSTKVKEGLNASFSFPADEPVKLSFRGCGITYDEEKEPENGKITVMLRDIVFMDMPMDCILEGAAIGSKVTRLTWQVWSYDSAFTPLAVPSAEVKNKKLTVKAEGPVSVLSLDDQYVIDNQTTFKFDPSKPHVLRLITTGGRLLIGEWSGSWTWKN